MSTDFLRIGPGCQGFFWNNANIAPSTGNLNVNQPTTVTVIVPNFGTETVRLAGVQATACALNTLHAFNSSSILPSLTGPNLNLLEFDNVFPFPNDVVIPAGARSQPIPLPQWTPTSNDIHHFDNIPGAAFDLPTKLTLHACIFANCWGSWPPIPTGQVTDDGQFFNWNSIANNFCADTHHGQLNTTLHRLANQRSLTVPFYAGFMGEGRLVPVTLRVVEVSQVGGIDPAIVEMIRRAGLGGLPIQPASKPAPVAGVAQFRSIAERIRSLFEEIGDEVHEFFEHLRGNRAFEDDESDDPAPKPLRQVPVVPNELHPLMLKAEFDEAEPFGTVHVFDVTQEDTSNIGGGFRLATIYSPD